MKEIKDYLHLYLGCEVSIGKYDYQGTLSKVGCSDMGEDCEITGENQDEESGFYGESEQNDAEHRLIKPILRPLSDMTKKENRELSAIIGVDTDKEVHIWTPDQFLWLLSKHFDVFGLIESGLAIDKTKKNT